MSNFSSTPVPFSRAILAIFDLYNYAYSLRDPEVDDFPLVYDPSPTVGICLFYIFLIQYLIPDFMEYRKPFNVRNILVVYNFGMVLVNVWLHYEFWMAGWGTGYSFLCENMDYSVNERTTRMRNLMWWYYISKFIDMFDTVFIALRKQTNKITFLHFFHHFSMPGNVWALVRFLPGGHCTFHGLVNSFVHSVMYFYYGVAALGSNYRKYLWWKKYVTIVQLIQFYLDCIHLALPLYFDYCGFPKYILVYMLSQTSLFLVLFTDFYIRTYALGQKSHSPVKKELTNGHVN